MEEVDNSFKQRTSFREPFYPRLVEKQTQNLSAEASLKLSVKVREP